ncbi:MAG TPA: diguanylate cyclase [Candidatus Dormibacteraeota bacterium]|jgi:diguanylate cyclase (GGDEF)-like protein|nr:diguanylate cyclase [Candidatus Dormibacteraeota bacterium]
MSDGELSSREREREREPRETSGITTRLIVRHVRARRGEQGVAELLRRAGTSLDVHRLEDESNWTGYDTKVALFEAAAHVLDDSQAARHIGETVLSLRVGLPLKLLLRALGSPGQVLRNIAKTAPRFSTVCTMAASGVGNGVAEVSYRLHPPHTPNAMDCAYNIGLISQVTVLFGGLPARIEHDECQVRGAECCVYRVRWTPRRRWSLRRGHARIADLEDQLSTLAERSRALQSTIADLVSTDDVDSVLARITTRAGEAVGAPRYLLAVRPGEDSALRVHHHGFGDDTPLHLVDELLTGATHESDSRRLVVDVESARRHYGRLAALWDGDGGWFPEERQLLAAYARHAAAALDAATALAEARDREQTATVLLELARALSRVASPRAVAQRITDAVPSVVTGVERVGVALWDGEASRLRFSSASGFSAAHTGTLLDLAIAPEDTDELRSMVATPQARYYAHDTADDFMRGVLSAFHATAIVVVPIVARDAFLGVICADTGADMPPLQVTASLWQRLTGLADLAATALENARLLEGQRVAMEQLRRSEEAARHQAQHDALTGLPNRLCFKERLHEAVRAATPDDMAAVLLIDLDHFKRVNDTLGHAAADHLLQEVAGRIAGCLREEDTAARLGGDEFAVVLRHVTAEGCTVVAGKIREACASPVDIEGTAVCSTMSIGIALCPGHGDDGESLLRHADTAMYRAKRAGRDAVRLYAERSAWGTASATPAS